MAKIRDIPHEYELKEVYTLIKTKKINESQLSDWLSEKGIRMYKKYALEEDNV